MSDIAPFQAEMVSLLAEHTTRTTTGYVKWWAEMPRLAREDPFNLLLKEKYGRDHDAAMAVLTERAILCLLGACRALGARFASVTDTDLLVFEPNKSIAHQVTTALGIWAGASNGPQSQMRLPLFFATHGSTYDLRQADPVRVGKGLSLQMMRWRYVERPYDPAMCLHRYLSEAGVLACPDLLDAERQRLEGPLPEPLVCRDFGAS